MCTLAHLVEIPTSKKNQFDLKWHLENDTLSVIEPSSNPAPSAYIVLPASKLLIRVLQDLTRLMRPHDQELVQNPDQHLDDHPNQPWDSSRELLDDIEQTKRYESFRRAYEKSRSESE